jgi:hypothetical protein
MTSACGSAAASTSGVIYEYWPKAAAFRRSRLNARLGRPRFFRPSRLPASLIDRASAVDLPPVLDGAAQLVKRADLDESPLDRLSFDVLVSLLHRAPQLNGTLQSRLPPIGAEHDDRILAVNHLAANGGREAQRGTEPRVAHVAILAVRSECLPERWRMRPAPTMDEGPRLIIRRSGGPDEVLRKSGVRVV